MYYVNFISFRSFFKDIDKSNKGALEVFRNVFTLI